METKRQIDLCTGETSPHEYLLVENLPLNCDILLGKNWPEKFGYRFQIPDLGINLPAYSENLVRIQLPKKEVR